MLITMTGGLFLGAQCTAFALFPPSLLRSFTIDNRNEFFDYQAVEQTLGTKTFFADPGCPGQRGLNENTNGLFRQYFPKKFDFSTISVQDLQTVVAALNSRPLSSVASFSCHSRLSQGSSVVPIISTLLQRMKPLAIKSGSFYRFSLQCSQTLTGGLLRQEALPAEVVFQRQVAPVHHGIPDGLWQHRREPAEFLPAVPVPGDVFLLHSVGLQEPPLVVVAPPSHSWARSSNRCSS